MRELVTKERFPVEALLAIHPGFLTQTHHKALDQL